MKLKSFGCSHVFGNEHNDCMITESPSQTVWPALLAQHWELDYECYAQPGLGNFFIAQQILNQISIKEPAVFVVNWTYIDRFDYTDPSNDQRWKACRPGENNLEALQYYCNLHSEFRDKLNTAMLMQLCIDALQKNNHPFIMTYMDDLIFDQQWHMSNGLRLLQHQLAPMMVTFDGLNFLERFKEQYPSTKLGHLLEDGHQAAADYILQLGVDKIQTLVGITLKSI